MTLTDDRPDTDTIIAMLQELEDRANAVVFEREGAVACFIAALLARCHVSLVGPPGVAKTFLGDVMTGMIAGLEGDGYFETQLAPKSDVAELFGHHTIDGLRAGRLVRNTERMLPRAKVAHISEFWNAPASANGPLNSLLNEGTFYNPEPEPCDLSTLIIDSNAMPPAGSALADRFTFRLMVTQLQGRASVTAMLRGADQRLITTGTARRPNVSPIITWDQITQAQRDVARIPFSEGAMEALVDLRFKLNEAGIYPSDRCLSYCLPPMKASAYRAGRPEVTAGDMTLLTHVLWTKPAELPKVQRTIYAVCSPLDLAATDLLDAVEALLTEYSQIATIGNLTSRKRAALELHDKINAIAHQLVDLLAKAKTQGVRLEMYAPLSGLLTDLGRRCLDLMPQPA